MTVLFNEAYLVIEVELLSEHLHWNGEPGDWLVLLQV